MSVHKLKKVEGSKKPVGRGNLKESLGVLFLIYGKSKQGCLNYKKLVEQGQDLLNRYEALLSNHQIVLEVGHSSDHAEGREGGLGVNDMNLNNGGKQ